MLCALLAGCASDRDWSLIPKVEDIAHKQEQKNVVVAAECWTRDEDMRALFKKTPPKEVLVVRLIIYNFGKKVVRFSHTQARLVLPDGTGIFPMAPCDVAKKMETNETAAAALIMAATGNYGVGIASLIEQAEAENNWQRKCAVRKCSMALATVDPGQTLTGFLFFLCPKDFRRKRNPSPVVTCSINRMPRVGASHLSFSIDLPLYKDVTKKEKKP